MRAHWLSALPLLFGLALPLSSLAAPELSVRLNDQPLPLNWNALAADRYDTVLELEPGRLHLVNSRYDKIGERPCFPSVAALPEVPDCCIVVAAKDAVDQPALAPRLEALGLTPAAQGPEALARFLATERAEMRNLIAAEGIRLE